MDGCAPSKGKHRKDPEAAKSIRAGERAEGAEPSNADFVLTLLVSISVAVAHRGDFWN